MAKDTEKDSQACLVTPGKEGIYRGKVITLSDAGKSDKIRT